MQEKETTTSDVREWWDKNPFTYLSGQPPQNIDWAFFRNIDRKVFKWMPWAHKNYPLLSSVIDYDALRGKKVLDIAVGTGWTTEQFCRAGADVTAIDLTPAAVELTKKRLALYGLQANVLVADGQNLPFENECFDYVLAWGCLMHMPDTQKGMNEIHRVLKPGGKAAAMMYYKHSLHWWWYIWLSKGILRGKLLSMTEQELANRYTDGVYEGGNELARFYTVADMKKMWGAFSNVLVSIYDDYTCVNHWPHRYFPFGDLLPERVKGWLVRHVGQTLWIEVKK